MSASVQRTTEAVFPVKESLEISGAVVLFEGLFGSVEFPELIGREQSASVANWNVSSVLQFCIFGVKGCSSISPQQCGLHLIKHLVAGAL